MNPLEILQLARADLACYAVAQWPGFELAAHHRLLVEMLEAVERGEIRRLLVAMPPRHGKSLLNATFSGVVLGAASRALHYHRQLRTRTRRRLRQSCSKSCAGSDARDYLPRLSAC